MRRLRSQRAPCCRLTVVDAIGQIAYLAKWLESLHRRGLAEQRDDRFGLPVCKAESYRRILLQDLDLAAAARGLSNWLTAADPTGCGVPVSS